MKETHHRTGNFRDHFYLRGLTLVEALVTTAIFTIVMTALVGSIIFFYRANTATLEQAFQVEDARRGVASLVRDIREATYGDNGAYPLAGIASTSITFYADTDKDAVIERIRYTLSGTKFFRNVLDSSGVPPVYTGEGATTTVSEHVRNDELPTQIFRYYDEAGVEITDYAEVDEVRSVAVSLIVNVQPIRAPEEFTLRSQATLRNLRD